MRTMKLREAPPRAVAGAFILHSGLQKWGADEEAVRGMHGFASGAYPFLSRIQPRRFIRGLSAFEITLGTMLLTPVVPGVVVGAALTGFSGALVGLYARTPGLRRPGSPWPTEDGTGFSKDAWLVGIGLGLVVDGVASQCGKDG